MGHHRVSGSGINGWAEPFYDKQAQCPKLKLTDFSLLSSIGSSGNRELTAGDSFKPFGMGSSISLKGLKELLTSKVDI